jgi:hypothetical protein
MRAPASAPGGGCHRLEVATQNNTVTLSCSVQVDKYTSYNQSLLQVSPITRLDETCCVANNPLITHEYLVFVSRPLYSSRADLRRSANRITVARAFTRLDRAKFPPGAAQKRAPLRNISRTHAWGGRNDQAIRPPCVTLCSPQTRPSPTPVPRRPPETPSRCPP